MKKVPLALVVSIGTILIIALCFGLSSLIFWSIGNLIIWAFKINYVWTIWHGLVCVLLFLLLKEIFGN